MAVKKTDRQKLAEAQLEIKQRGVEIGVLKRKAKRLEDAEIMMKRHEARWLELEGENEVLEVRMAGVIDRGDKLKQELAVQTEATKTAREMIRTHCERVDACEVRIHELVDRIWMLRRGLRLSWNQNDMLLEQLAGALPMSDNRPCRDHIRDKLWEQTHAIVGDMP